MKLLNSLNLSVSHSSPSGVNVLRVLKLPFESFVSFTDIDSLQDNWPSVLPTSRSQSSNLNFIPHNLTKSAAQKESTEEKGCSSQVVLT